jgi:hypothetical protein
MSDTCQRRSHLKFEEMQKLRNTAFTSNNIETLTNPAGADDLLEVDLSAREILSLSCRLREQKLCHEGVLSIRNVGAGVDLLVEDVALLDGSDETQI